MCLAFVTVSLLIFSRSRTFHSFLLFFYVLLLFETERPLVKRRLYQFLHFICTICNQIKCGSIRHRYVQVKIIAYPVGLNTLGRPCI